LEVAALAKESKMKQMLQVRKAGKVAAGPVLDQAPAQPMATISEADLDKVSGGGGAPGGVLGDSRVHSYGGRGGLGGEV
jgi:hypothetical protein